MTESCFTVVASGRLNRDGPEDPGYVSRLQNNLRVLGATTPTIDVLPERGVDICLQLRAPDARHAEHTAEQMIRVAACLASDRAHRSSRDERDRVRAG